VQILKGILTTALIAAAVIFPLTINAPARATTLLRTVVIPQPDTIINDQATLERLLGNSGITVQWLTWDQEGRGELSTSWQGKVLYIEGSHKSQTSSGIMTIKGSIVQVDKDRFLFDGRITITETPDAGRKCVKDGISQFAVTQRRKYFRLREFEWCDHLTDYIDIFF
jgi:hypothetical protein